MTLRESCTNRRQEGVRLLLAGAMANHIVGVPFKRDFGEYVVQIWDLLR